MAKTSLSETHTGKPPAELRDRPWRWPRWRLAAGLLAAAALAAMRRRRPHRWARWSLAAGLILAAVALAVMLPRLAEAYLTRRLHQAGFAGAEAIITGLTLGSIEGTVRLDPAGTQRIDEVTLSYSLAGLSHLRADRLDLRGVRLNLVVDADGSVRLGNPEASPLVPGLASDAPFYGGWVSRLASFSSRIADGIGLSDARFAVDTPIGRITVPIALILTRTEPGGMRIDGKAGFDHLSASALSVFAVAVQADGRFDGDIELTSGADHARGGVAGWAAVAGGGGRPWAADLQLHADRLVVPGFGTLAAGLTYHADAARQTLLTRAADPVHGLDERADIDVTASGAGGAQVAVETTATIRDLWPLAEPAGAWSAAGAPGRVALSLAGRLARADGKAGLLDRLDLTGSLDLAASDGSERPGANDRALAVAGALAVGGGRIELTGAAPWRIAGTLAALGLALPAADQPVRVQLSPGDDLPLRLSIAPGRDATTARLSGIASAEVGTGAGDDGAARLTGRLAELAVTRPVGRADATPAVALKLAAGRLVLPSAGLVADGIDLAASAEPTRADPLVAEATVETLRGAAGDPLVAPVRLRGAARSGPAGALDFRLAASDATGVAALDVVGRHDPAAGAGHAVATLRPTRFGPSGSELLGIVPALKPYLDLLTGTVALRADAGWGPGAEPARASLLLRDVAVSRGPMRLQGVNGVLDADHLSPLSLPAGQVLAAGALDAGLPLADGIVEFGLEAGTRLLVSRAEWRCAGGDLRASPFTADLDGARVPPVELQAGGLDLGGLLAAVGIPGLEGTGTLNGQFRLELQPAFAITQGVLDAAGPGLLRYEARTPGSALAGDAGSDTAQLLQALTDFHYDTLRLTLAREADAGLLTELKVAGANPGFYNGYPVELALRLDGGRGGSAYDGRAGYRIPEAVAARMAAFERSLASP